MKTTMIISHVESRRDMTSFDWNSITETYANVDRKKKLLKHVLPPKASFLGCASKGWCWCWGRRSLSVISLSILLDIDTCCLMIEVERQTQDVRSNKLLVGGMSVDLIWNCWKSQQTRLFSRSSRIKAFLNADNQSKIFVRRAVAKN